LDAKSNTRKLSPLRAVGIPEENHYPLSQIPDAGRHMHIDRIALTTSKPISR